jgi:hypothetical protein
LALALVVIVVAIWSKDGCSNGDAGRENGDSGSGFGSKGLGVRGGFSLKGLGVLPCWEWNESGSVAWLRLALGVCCPSDSSSSSSLSYSSSEVSSDEGIEVRGDNFGWELILTIFWCWVWFDLENLSGSLMDPLEVVGEEGVVVSVCCYSDDDTVGSVYDVYSYVGKGDIE